MGLGGKLDVAHVAALLPAWVLVCGLWWAYFAFSASAVAYALEIAESPSRVVRWIFSYGHYGLTCSIIAIAVALEHIVHAPGERLHGEQWLLCGGAALYLAVFTWQRWIMFRTVSPTRAPAAVVALLLGVVASLVPGIVGLRSSRGSSPGSRCSSCGSSGGEPPLALRRPPRWGARTGSDQLYRLNRVVIHPPSRRTGGMIDGGTP